MSTAGVWRDSGQADAPPPGRYPAQQPAIDQEKGMGKSRRTRAEITFAVQPGAESDGSGLAFSGVAYSGDVVEQWGRRIVVNLDAVDGEIEVPVLTDHDNEVDAIAGRGRVFMAESDGGGRELRIEGALTSATEAGRKVSALMAEDFPMRLSIGFDARMREAGGEIEVNGRKLSADIVMEEPQIREVSFVAVPADPRAHARQVMLCADLEPGAVEPSVDPEIARLNEALAAAEARAEAAEQAVEAARCAWREAEIARLFTDIGREPPEDVSAYLEMSDSAFRAWADDVRSFGARTVDPALLTPVAPKLAGSGGMRPDPSERLMHVVEKLSRGPEIN